MKLSIRQLDVLETAMAVLLNMDSEGDAFAADLIEKCINTIQAIVARDTTPHTEPTDPPF